MKFRTIALKFVASTAALPCASRSELVHEYRPTKKGTTIDRGFQSNHARSLPVLVLPTS
jgi:hypothetical protein